MKKKIKDEDETEENFSYSLISRDATNIEVRFVLILIKRRNNNHK